MHETLILQSHKVKKGSTFKFKHTLIDHKYINIYNCVLPISLTHINTAFAFMHKSTNTSICVYIKLFNKDSESTSAEYSGLSTRK